MLARFAGMHLPIDSADVLRSVRLGETWDSSWLPFAIAAHTFDRSAKASLDASRKIESFISTSGTIYLFDRKDSFECLRPEEEAPDAPVDEREERSSEWSELSPILRFDRNPRIFAILTLSSLAGRTACYGDAGVEQLIGNVEAGFHSLTIVDESSRAEHRILRGIFADSDAIAIFGRQALAALPCHGRSIRLYEASNGRLQTRIIAESIRLFRRMKRFSAHSPSQQKLMDVLRGFLSYQVPYREDIDRN
jgi:hypothetical protein